jgi:hypothetical protein
MQALQETPMQAMQTSDDRHLVLHDVDWSTYGRLLRAFAERPAVGGGSTTIRRRRRRKGLEPDECFWITNEPRMRGKDRIDLRVDPPPDLALEVDVTRSSMDRMGIYSALGVPEVWRLDDPQTLSFRALQVDRTYRAVDHSLAFPIVMPADLMGFLALRGQMDENAVIRQFRAWVRQHLLGEPRVKPGHG